MLATTLLYLNFLPAARHTYWESFDSFGMVRRNNRTRRGRGRRRGRAASIPASLSGVDRLERVPGKFLIPVAALTTAIPLTIDAFGLRLSTLGNVFQEHRFTQIRVVLHPGYVSAGTARTSYAVGYFKVLPQIPPTTVANLYQGAVSRYSDQGDTMPVVLNLNRSTLMGNVRNWFTNNSATGTESLDSTQGVLYIIGIGSAAVGLAVNIEVSYVCELRGATLPTVD